MFVLHVVFPKIEAPEDLAPCYRRGPPKTKYRPTCARPQVVHTHHTALRPVQDSGRLIHSRIDPVVDPQLPREQAGFRRGRSTVDRVTLLTQDIEGSFQYNEKAGVVFLDLTAAYDTVWWHRGLHLKLLRMVGFIMEMLSNRSFVVHTSDRQRSRLRRMKNGVPQCSVLSPMLFNIYISDLPETTSRKYGYADDLAILLQRPSWKEMEEGLNNDMTILVDYLRKWYLQLSIGKTVSAAYQLNNREAKRELDVFVDNKRLVFQQAPKYLGVRLDRMLNFKQHLEEVAGKVTSRVSRIPRLAGTTWGASAKTLRISTQALLFPAAEYCAPVWSRSPHVKKVDVAINSSLRTIYGCLKPTPVFLLPVLAGIAPAGLRRKAATLALTRKAMKHDWHILHDTTKTEVPSCRLKSRKPYNKEAQEMLSVILEDRSKDASIAATWKQEWEASGPTRVHRHVSKPEEGVKGEDLRRKHWMTLNRLRTGVGRYKASMEKWGLADSAACECGEPEQTAEHINSWQI